MAVTRTHYKYEWEIKFFIKKLNRFVYPYKLERMMLECDYQNRFLPIITMFIRIYEADLDFFSKYNNQIICMTKLTRLSSPDGITYTGKVIEEEADYIPIYDKKDIPDIMNTTKDVGLDINDNKKSYEESLGRNQNHLIPMKLIKINDSKIKKFMHNYVLDNATVSDGLSLLIDQNSYVKKALIDIPGNTTTYTDLIIPAYEIKDAIKHLQLRYGIYSRGLITFLLKDILYILEKVSHQHSFAEGEKQMVEIALSESTSIPNSKDYVSEDDNTIRYERTGKLSVNDKETIEGELIGDKYIYSNFGSVINSMFAPEEGQTEFLSPINTIDRNVTTHLETGTKVISDYDNLNNVFNLSSHMNETGVGIPVTLYLQSINTNHFTPNKTVKLVLDSKGRNTLYGGIYSISKYNIIYNNTAKVQENFLTYAHCSLELNYKYNGQYLK